MTNIRSIVYYDRTFVLAFFLGVVLETDGVIYGRGLREIEAFSGTGLDLCNDPFVEFELEDPSSVSSKEPFSTPPDFRDFSTHPILQPQQLSFDQTHQLFGDMRQIARHNKWLKRSRDELFYWQALFMKDFNDQWDEEVEFSRYYPSYEKMNYGQLRTYFSWRTKARKGQIQESSLSYIFLFIYELLNNIGVEESQDGLNQLISLWAELRNSLPELDQYVLPWIKDYYIYYPVVGSFHSFVSEYQLHAHYPTVYCRNSDSSTSFALFNEVSSYRISDSVFYSDETKNLIDECFCFVLDRLRENFQAKNVVFEDFVFFTSRTTSKWVPFSKALFHPTLKQTPRRVIISEQEKYECDGNEWFATKVFPCAQGSQLIGYIMKEIEVFLRGIRSFRYRLTANIDSFKAIDQSQFSRLGISLPHLVKDACAAFHKAVTWKTVSVDLGNLNLIRKEANETQEKLIVPEDIAENVVLELPEIPVQEAELKQPIKPEEPTSIWDLLIESLNPEEKEAVSLICNGKAVEEYALEQGILLEVLVDNVNEKAIEATGDTIMELIDAPLIFEEYLPSLLAALQNKSLHHQHE